MKIRMVFKSDTLSKGCLSELGLTKMFCCLGILVGIIAGSIFGGPWAFIAPAAGFGLGFAADMKLRRGGHGCSYALKGSALPIKTSLRRKTERNGGSLN